MVSEYVSAALGKAHYEILSEHGSYYGEIQGFEGVYANAKTLEACREELVTALRWP
jgi:predicted RNase H-like HicB family nuclease